MMWPLVVYFAFVVVLVAGVLIVSYLLGKDIPNPLPVSLMKAASFRKVRRMYVSQYVTTWSRCSSSFLIWKRSSCSPGPERLAN